jgi:hypothetical protein
MYSAKLPHIALGRAVRRAVFASVQRCSQSLMKLFACLLCIAKLLIQRFNKRVLDGLQRATRAVATFSRRLLAKERLISSGAVTSANTTPASLHGYLPANALYWVAFLLFESALFRSAGAL